VFSLKNKTALVTGAASGIGAAIAQTFAEAGATVWIADTDAAGGKAVANRINGKFIALDVTKEAACTQAAQAVGLLDILANVAGIGHVGTLINTTAADLDKLYAVNVRGIFNGCKAFVPAMLDKKNGSVINMASIGGVVAVRERLAYTTTKFAVVGLTIRILASGSIAFVLGGWKLHLCLRASKNTPTRKRHIVIWLRRN
jgi:2-keto-3-deoxy-L-fuconate dehydrogenase